VQDNGMAGYRDVEVGTEPVLEVAGHRATVRLNRPRQHNRIEPADLRWLGDCLERIDADDSIRVLVLTGTGRTFSSGFHIGALAERRPATDGARDNKFAEVADRLEHLQVPTVCALNGGVYGGATDLALACDFRIGVHGMRFVMPAAKLGIHYYESGLRRYVTRLGIAAAKRLFLTAQPVEADELLRIGFVDELVSPDALSARVDELAEIIAGNAPLSLRGMKRSLNQIAAGTLDREGMEAARAACAVSADHKEGLAAWAERRKPAFQGR
jgi:enoyl-CoA hydratase/carnithine racemase